MSDVLIVAAAVVTVLVLVLSVVLGSPRVKGAAGERRVRRTLERVLDPADFEVFHDVTLPVQGGTTQLDHVVLSRFGAFVIETKNMSGWIFGTEDQARWTQVRGRRKFSFQNPLRQNHGHVKAVQAMLLLEPHQVHSVIAFVGDARPKTSMPDCVVWGTRALAKWIAAPRLPVISQDKLETLASRLAEARLEPGWKTHTNHVRHVNATLAARSPNGHGCPRCGAKMIKRKARKTGELFLGCARYPDCRGKRSVGPSDATVVPSGPAADSLPSRSA